MKLLAERLQSVIYIIVDPHQTCEINKRSIVTNERVARRFPECCVFFVRRVVELRKSFDGMSHDFSSSFIIERVNWGGFVRQCTHG